MPLYEYECPSCAIRFERRQSFQDEPLKTCPECGAPVHRVLYPAGIIFKGSGFYTTDYARKGQGDSEKSEPSSSS